MNDEEDEFEEVELSPKPHSRVSPELAKAQDRKAVLGLALGAASSCWDNLAEAGVFDSEQANLIVEDTLQRLRELDKANLGLASTADLINEIAARFQTFQYAVNQSFTDFLNYRTVDSK